MGSQDLCQYHSELINKNIELTREQGIILIKVETRLEDSLKQNKELSSKMDQHYKDMLNLLKKTMNQDNTFKLKSNDFLGKLVTWSFRALITIAFVVYGVKTFLV